MVYNDELKKAKEECHRWLTYVTKQKEKSVAVQKIAGDVRNNLISREEAQRRLRLLDNQPTVYSGEKLVDAIRFLLKHLK